MEGPPPQPLSAEDMLALATALLPSLLLQQTHIPRGYGHVGYPIPDGEYIIKIEEKGMEWVAGWVRAARPDLTDACTHGLALPLLSLASRTWFQQGTEDPTLWVHEDVGDAIVVSEEAVAAFYATLHSNCVVKGLGISQGAHAFGTPAAAAHLGRCLNLNSTLRQLTIEAALRIRRGSGSCWGEAAWTALSEALTSNATIEAVNIHRVPAGLSSHVSATFAAASQKLSALRTFWLFLDEDGPPETATLGGIEGWGHVLKHEKCTLTELDLGLLLPAHGGLVAICEALLTNTTLEWLKIGPHRYVHSTASIEAMVTIEEADAEALAAMLRTNTTLTTLKMRSSGILWNAMVVEQGLSCNSSLKELEVSLDPDGAHALMTLLQRPGGPTTTSTATPASDASSTCPSQLKYLKLGTKEGRGFPTASALTTFFLGPGGGLEALSDNTSITRLRLVPHEFPSKRLSLGNSPDALLARLLPILHKSETLQELDLTVVRPDWGWPAEFGRGLIRSLKHNPSVTVLILDGWDFLDDVFLQDLLESLRDNTNLKRISIENTPWKSQGKETTIRQALRQVAYLSVLKKHADITVTPPKSGRLFLCGPGYAGKTTLRGSLIRSWKSRARKKWIARLWARVRIMASPRRTKGIEIEVLREDDTMRVTIWDLAGQDTFRILQQHLFPTVSQACIFFLVFSPFDQETGQVKLEWQEDLQVQLRDWLRFITSNTSTKLHGSVEAYVILTHLDMMSGHTSVTMKDYAKSTIQNVCREFAGVLAGAPESVQVFALDCKSERDVAPLLDDVFGRFEQLFGSRLFLVPKPCTDMSIVLAKWTSDHPNQPIMRLEQFHALCRSEVVALQDPAGQDERANPVQDAISSYLHDVGVIMFFKDLRFLVVNPNWVTHVLLGQLIKFGCSKMPSTKHGVVTESQLELVLKQFVKQGRYKGFNEKDLILLMLKLELCYKEEPDTSGVTRYFVPTTLDDANGNALTGKRPVDWPVNVDPAAKDCIHIGRRLQCEDEIKTVLGPGFFPKLQVRLRNRLFEKKEQIRMAADQYQIQRNLITFHTEGIQVILESPGDIADYVDILVKSFGKTQEQTMGFLMEHVIEEVQSLRESIIPGVVLLEGIIRKACVRKLTLCAHRRNQAVLRQELLSRLEALVDSYQNPLDYLYTWTKVPETDDCELDCAYEKATDLLDPGELRDTLSKKLEQQMTKIDEAARLVVGETQSNEQTVPRVSPHNQKDPALKPTLSTQMRSGFADVLFHISSGNNDVKEHISRENKKLLHGMKEVLGIQERIMDTLLTKMDEIMNFSAQLLSTQMPRRPYFTTSDTGQVHRLVATTRIGKAVMLHFMCEARGGHIVEGQAGYELIVEDADWKWIRPIAVNAVRLLVFLVKAGLHVAAGIGDAVSDYAKWSGAIPLTAGALSGETLLGQINAKGNTCSEKDWDALREKMEPLLKGKMVELFGLYKVRFTRDPQQRVGWVCSNCLRSGKANDILEAL